MVEPPAFTAAVAHSLVDALSWWDKVNESTVWQDRIFHVLAGLYGVVAVIALVIFSILTLNLNLNVDSFIFTWICILFFVSCSNFGLPAELDIGIILPSSIFRPLKISCNWLSYSSNFQSDYVLSML